MPKRRHISTTMSMQCSNHWMRNCQKEKKAHSHRTTYLNRFGSTVDGLTTGQMSCSRQCGVANHWAMNDVNCWHLVSGWTFDRPENVRMERNVNSVKIQAIYWQCNTHLLHTHDSSKWRQMETAWRFGPSTDNVTHTYHTCDSSKWRQMYTVWRFRPCTDNVTHLSHLGQFKMETNVNSMKIQAIYWQCNKHLSHLG